MEHNGDEAIEAKGIAEKNIESGDYEGAIRFALKAQSLFPSLEGISQMITTFRIYLASTMKIAGENNRYSILSVPMLVDDETLEKQHTKLVREIRPDRNKTVGAHGAFYLIQKAWAMLSNKQRRASYDQWILQQEIPQQSTSSASSGASSGSQNSAANASTPDEAGLSKQMEGSSAPAAQHSQPLPTPLHHPARALVESTEGPLTFWTSCNKCYTQYEFYKNHLNLNLRCCECSQPFIATETQIPVKRTKNNKATKVGSSSSTASLRKKSFSSTDLDYRQGILLEQLDEDYRRYILLKQMEVALKKQLNDTSTMNGNGVVKDSGGDN
ncbi:hypothetical protein C2845_PM13G05700 [Panicum miliaceum]|uniref:J domain-containing protein n=1 Tax=Panicum miliaceum TaxID=4540 RepID=A0A3L6RMG1_PANMI|nr:hypothetical protein C2845_PM13G05700 [Panicum miliaceum]